jgi:probable HAF family extracellular repeat protein
MSAKNIHRFVSILIAMALTISGSTSALASSILDVSIDIKPGSFPNSVNLKSEGVIPVAILTTDSFDAFTVDANTVRFGVTGMEAAPVLSVLSDVDRDGDLDLILHFNVVETGLVMGDTLAQLSGKTFDDQLIQGSDSVNIVSKPKKVKPSVVDLGTLGGNFSFARDINGRGQVTGVSTTRSSESDYHAFFWQNGKMTDLGTLGAWASFSEGQFINDQGQVAGVLIFPPDPFGHELRHPFFWQNGVMTDLRLTDTKDSIPTGLSENGHVIGSNSRGFATGAFLWQNGVMNDDLGTLGGAFTNAVKVNVLGQVTGASTTPLGFYHAFVWQNGVMTDLGTLGVSESSPIDINDSGQIVGFSETVLGARHTFLWQNGVMTDLGTLGGADSYPYDINNQGQIIGISQIATGESHAFLWQNGVMTDLGTLGGADSDAYYVNDQGQILGISQTSSGYIHAFVWQNGVMTDLGTLGGYYSVAQAINARGQVIGGSNTASGEFHDFLWQNGTMTDLTTSGMLGAIAINDLGQILGYTQTSSGETHAALLQK